MTGGFEESNEVCANAYASVHSLANHLRACTVPTSTHNKGGGRTEKDRNTNVQKVIQERNTMCV